MNWRPFKMCQYWPCLLQVVACGSHGQATRPLNGHHHSGTPWSLWCCLTLKKIRKRRTKSPNSTPRWWTTSSHGSINIIKALCQSHTPMRTLSVTQALLVPGDPGPRCYVKRRSVSIWTFTGKVLLLIFSSFFLPKYDQWKYSDSWPVETLISRVTVKR